MELSPDQITPVLQKILDDAVSSGEESALELCVFQHGQLIADLAAGTNGTLHGLMPVFSVGKGIVSTALHQIHEAGWLDYERKVGDYWPEFACNGKENIRVRDVLSHRTGLHVLPADVTLEQQCDWEYMCHLMEQMTPAFEPGSRCGYQAVTFAWLAGELARRAAGVSLQTWIREFILIPLGIDRQFYFGTDDDAEERLLPLDDSAVTEKTCWPRDFIGSRKIREAFIPSANGVGSACAVAKHYAGLLNGQLLKPETLAHAAKITRTAADPVRGERDWSRFGLGYVCAGPDSDMEGVIGHGGAAGAEGWADLRNDIAVGFVKNKISPRHPDHPVRGRIADALGVKKIYYW